RPPIHSSFGQSSPPHRSPHSFPTRRSSDLHLRARLQLHPFQPPRLRRVDGLVVEGAEGAVGRGHVAARVRAEAGPLAGLVEAFRDRKSTRLNSSHVKISYAVFCLKKKKTQT